MPRILSQKEAYVLDVVRRYPGCSSGKVTEYLRGILSLATVKRTLRKLVDTRALNTEGAGKATRYFLQPRLSALLPIDLNEYFSKDADERNANTNFDHSFITGALRHLDLFSAPQLKRLDDFHRKFQANLATLTPGDQRREMERLAIDLSWKSSQIEGNTYSLLETEVLLREQVTAAGKTTEEATMLLNHKKAIDFIISSPGYVQPLTISAIEDIHSLLTGGLNVSRNIRSRQVRITGTNYCPPDNEFQIREALQDLCDLVNAREIVFEKAVFALALISWIQPFMDGNKRTARIISNALLMSQGYCPLSYRTVNSLEYKKAMLLFYEQNNLYAVRNLFMFQYEYAVEHYF